MNWICWSRMSKCLALIWSFFIWLVPAWFLVGFHVLFNWVKDHLSLWMFSAWCISWGSIASLYRKGTSCILVKWAKWKMMYEIWYLHKHLLSIYDSYLIYLIGCLCCYMRPTKEKSLRELDTWFQGLTCLLMLKWVFNLQWSYICQECIISSMSSNKLTCSCLSDSWLGACSCGDDFKIDKNWYLLHHLLIS